MILFTKMYSVCCAFVLATLFATPSGVILQPIARYPTILNDTTACPNIDQIFQSITQSITNQIDQSVSANLSCLLNLGSSAQCAANSCHDIASVRPNYPSGYYWILNSTNDAIRVYCDLVRVLNGSLGWMRVVYVNMTDPAQSCPSAWKLNTPPTGDRLCGRPSSSNAGCFSVNYSVDGVLYSKICGWIRGYNYNTNDGFNRWNCASPCPYTFIDQPYVDGVSITRNSPSRQHVWSYASASAGGGACPCYPRGSYVNSVPAFVGSSWYCQGQVTSNSTYYYNYPLWTGAAACAGYTQAPCCRSPDLPWFCTIMPTQVRDNLEVRICSDQAQSDEDTRLQNVELYVF